jgi:hypothetical protein
LDSYFSDTDLTGCSASKTLALVEQRHSMVVEDTYQFPFLNEKLVNILVTDAKAKCFALYKQRTHAYADRDNRRARVKSQGSKFRASKQANRKVNQSRDYGRRRP